jgi:uncharacterized ferritin-like protein (DUF455 family)
MTVHDYARTLIEATTLEGKLAPPDGLRATPEDPSVAPLRLLAPGRPDSLRIRPAREVKVPRKAAMANRDQRGRILHALVNHELQAVELFAWALLAFPDTPAGFRNGLLAILADEQRHMQLYMECMRPLGVAFGDLPVTGHFWNRIGDVQTPLHFVCVMGLTFENANIDFAGEYAEYARAGKDMAAAQALSVVHDDEIRHVRFAWKWLHKFKRPEDSAWDAYVANIAWPLSPARARGKNFDTASRVAAGLSQEFIDKLAAVTARRPNGAPQ